MKNIKLLVLALVLTAALASCKSDPGPLKGTWQMSGIMPVKIEFRSGETETMGVIEKVSYEIQGDDVIVTNENGIAKGTSFRYTIVSADTVKTELGILKRVK